MFVGIVFFKYFDFFSQAAAHLLELLHLGSGQVVLLKLVLPVGISFYTFQTLSYIIDVYCGRLAAEPNLAIYALYVSFFPQLVAGPIERATNLLPQFRTHHTFCYKTAVKSGKLILWGMLKKICIADVLAAPVDIVFGNIRAYTGPSIVLAAVFFAFQIYCDFSAYSDIAVGSAGLLGIRLMKNFDCPYFAVSIQDFWRRWHISLSTWLRDYLYIPLGGSRKGRGRKYFNLMLTFGVSGLWHGANWTFMFWGLLNGFFQVIGDITHCWRENLRRRLGLRETSLVVRLIKWGMTFCLICFSWIFFRANFLSDAWYAVAHLFSGWNIEGIWTAFMILGQWKRILLLLTALTLLLVYDGMEAYGVSLWDWLSQRPRFVRWGVYYLLLAAVFVMFLYTNGGYGDAIQFIYFQF